MRQLVILIASLILVATAYPVTIHVPGDQPTIQAGIDAAGAGDTVLVAAGVYSENIDFLGKTIVVVSSDGAEVTALEPASPGSNTVTVSDVGPGIAQLSGFTIRYGGSINTVWLSNCMNPMVISDNIFHSNMVGYMGNESVIRCDVLDVLITRNLFYGNGGISCVGVYSSSWSATIINNTFDSNNRGFHTHGTGVAKNNIVTNSTQYGIAVDGSFAELDYNDVWNNNPDYQSLSPGPNDISLDPMFSDQTNHDYRLQATSPCIDAGDPDSQYNDPDGTRNDMGALPFDQVELPPVLDSIGAKTAFEGDTLTFRVTASDPNGTVPDLFAANLPDGASFTDSGNGRGGFFWPIAAGQYGSFSVVFIASDGVLADSESVSINVLSRPPSIDNLTIDGSDSTQHIIAHEPLIEWQYVDFGEDQEQQRFEIAVGTDDDWTYAEMWNPAPFDTSDTFVTYAGTALIDGETYYLRLRVYNGLDWSQWYKTSFRMNSLPSVPVLLHPGGGEVTGRFPTLWIENSVDAEGDTLTYDFLGYHDTDCMDGGPIDMIGVPEESDSTGAEIDSTLAENCIHWWRARAFDGYEYSEWSEFGIFLVDGVVEPPTVPQANYPPDTSGMPVYDMLPTFIWSQSYDPDPLDTVRYKLEISIDSNFTFVFTIDSLPSTSHTLTDSLGFNTHYWWRVIAFDKTGLSSPSWNQPDFWSWTLGDVDHSHVTDISDLTRLVDYLFITYTPIYPLKVGDVNGDCLVDIGDTLRE